MNREALFCDGTQDYVIPAEPEVNEKITLRFRTAHNDVEEVSLLTGDRSYSMWKICAGDEFDFYEIEWQLGEEPFHYSFEIKSGEQIWFYNRYGVSDHREDYYAYTIVPGFKTPEWAKGAVMYQIFVDRFCNGDTSNDVEDNEYIYIGAPSRKIKDWDQVPEALDIRNFYGGDLQGVLDKLDYLQDLGIEVIYFNPLFVSPSNHKYDIQDYDYIDPHYGKIIADGGEPLPEGAEDNIHATKYQQRVGDIRNLEASNELFAKLVEEMHKRGMRVILDGVFNHCGSFNKWLDRERIYEPQPGYPKGAYVSADSPYRGFFHFHDDRDEAWPYNGSYDGWWGHDTLPKLAYEDSKSWTASGRPWMLAANNLAAIYIGKDSADLSILAPFLDDSLKLNVKKDYGRIEVNNEALVANQAIMYMKKGGQYSKAGFLVAKLNAYAKKNYTALANTIYCLGGRYAVDENIYNYMRNETTPLNKVVMCLAKGTRQEARAALETLDAMPDAMTNPKLMYLRAIAYTRFGDEEMDKAAYALQACLDLDYDAGKREYLELAKNDGEIDEELLSQAFYSSKYCIYNGEDLDL